LVGALILAVSNLTCGAAAFGVNEPALGSAGIVVAPEPSEMRVRFLPGELPVVQGTIGGRPRQNILIDTGTSPAVLDAGLARSLGLQTSAASLQLFDGTIAVPGVWISELQIGPIRKRAVPAIVKDLSYFKRDYGLSVDAVIGLDVLGEVSFRLDYRAKRLIFGRVPAEGIVVHAEAGWPLVVVNVQMQKQRLRLLVDTGAAGLILFGKRVDTRRMQFELARRARADNLGGRVNATAVRDVDVVLQGKHVRADTAFLVRDDGELKEFDGLLGIGTLGFRALSYDRQSHTLYLQR
jgi:predicted aspartyl protease